MIEPLNNELPELDYNAVVELVTEATKKDVERFESMIKDINNWVSDNNQQSNDRPHNY